MGEASPEPLPAPQDPFLCFHRRGEGDLIIAGTNIAAANIAGAKIAGSAQRRRHGSVLQHGSVLLSTSPAAPDLPGLADLGGQNRADVSGQPLDADTLRQAWLAHLTDSLQLDLSPSTLSAAERQTAIDLQRTKYSAPDWTYRR